MKQKITRLIIGYHQLSRSFWVSLPLFVPSGCRFEPTCAEYSALAIEKHGVLWGLGKGFFRILRCNPLTKPAVDLP